MRKVLSLVSACVLAVALLVVTSPAANAFGSEVLGCAFDSGTWIANSCEGGGDQGQILHVQFSPHNLSGTYSKRWTVYNEGGTPVTASCSTGALLCIESGCTSTSTICTVETKSGLNGTHQFSAQLQLTQSGNTRTIAATAFVDQV
jgi:hypothetical protein